MIRNPSRATSFAKGTYEEEGKKARIGVPKARLEIANMKKWRRVDEDAIWSWWMVGAAFHSETKSDSWLECQGRAANSHDCRDEQEKKKAGEGEKGLRKTTTR